MYSFEYTPPYNFTDIQFLPNESLKRELKLSFELLINAFMKISENLQFKTVHEMSKHNLNNSSQVKLKKMIYSF